MARIETFKGDQAKGYADFSKQSFSWDYIERPGFDRMIGDLDLTMLDILDVGCANGRTIQYLVDSGADKNLVTGIDISEDILAIAKLTIPAAHFAVASAAELPFRPAAFDLVTSSLVWHKLDRETSDRAIASVAHVLRPNGTFFLLDTMPNPRKLGEWTEMASPWGTSINVFNHDLAQLFDAAVKHGLVVSEFGSLPVLANGLRANPSEYERYTSRDYPFRFGARFQKV